MSKHNKKHPDPELNNIQPEERKNPTAGQHQPDILDGKNKRKRNDSPQPIDPEGEPNFNTNEEEPVEEKSPHTSASL